MKLLKLVGETRRTWAKAWVQVSMVLYAWLSSRQKKKPPRSRTSPGIPPSRLPAPCATARHRSSQPLSGLSLCQMLVAGCAALAEGAGGGEGPEAV